MVFNRIILEPLNKNYKMIYILLGIDHVFLQNVLKF